MDDAQLGADACSSLAHVLEQSAHAAARRAHVDNAAWLAEVERRDRSRMQKLAEDPITVGAFEVGVRASLPVAVDGRERRRLRARRAPTSPARRIPKSSGRRRRREDHIAASPVCPPASDSGKLLALPQSRSRPSPQPEDKLDARPKTRALRGRAAGLSAGRPSEARRCGKPGRPDDQEGGREHERAHEAMIPLSAQAAQAPSQPNSQDARPQSA